MWRYQRSATPAHTHTHTTTSTTTNTTTTTTNNNNNNTVRPVTVSGRILLYTWFHLRMRSLLNARTLEKIQHTKILNRQI
jgi:hypothetical protein